MLNEKVRTKAFNKAINVIKSTRFGAEMPNHWFANYLKAHRSEVLARAEKGTGVPPSNEDILQCRILNTMSELLLELYSPAHLDLLKATANHLEEIEARLQSLKVDLEAGVQDWSAEPDRWVADETVVCRPGAVPPSNGQHLISLEDPRPLIWALRHITEIAKELPIGCDSKMLMSGATEVSSFSPYEANPEQSTTVALTALDSATEAVHSMLTDILQQVESADYRLHEPEILDRAVQDLKLLRDSIISDGPAHEKAACFWGGAGVVVISEDSDRIYEDDCVVRLPDPRPLVWLIEQLKSVCGGVLTWATKGAFYGRIAEIALAHVEEKGQSSPQTQVMLLDIVDDILAQLQDYRIRIEPERDRLLESIRSLGNASL